MPYSKTDWRNDLDPYLSEANLDKIEQGIVDAEPHRGTAPPSSPAVGKIWEDTNFTPAVIKAWTGSAWESANVQKIVDLADATNAANGDALVGYKLTGFTGTVARTVHDKLNEGHRVSVADYGASLVATQTTGTISSGSNSLLVTNATSFEVNHGIRIEGAGVAGAALVTKITAISGTTFTLRDNASTTATTQTVGHDDIEAFQAAAAAAQGTRKHYIVPPGTHRVSGTIGFDCTNLQIEAYGASIIQMNNNAVLFDLNTTASTSADNNNYQVRFHGGQLSSNSVVGSNTNVGIRARTVEHGEIAHVRGEKFGAAFIEFDPRDCFHIRECSGYMNYRHVHSTSFEVSVNPGNPQISTIENCGWSTHIDKGIFFERLVNALNITGCAFIDGDAIVVSCGTTAQRSRRLDIHSCSFEQGDSGDYYIRTVAAPGSAQKFHTLNIYSNDFNDSPPKIAELVDVRGANLYSNDITSNAAGWLTIGSGSEQVNVGRNTYFNMSNPFGSITNNAAPHELDYVWPEAKHYLKMRYRSVIEDEFASGNNTTGSVGDLGWILFNSATAAMVTGPGVGRVGAVRLDSGAVISQFGALRLHVTGTGNVMHPTDYFDALFIVKPVVADTTVYLRVGLASAQTAAATDGLFFEKATANTTWYAVARAASVETGTNVTSGVTATTADYVRLRIRRKSATQIEFWVNDTLTNTLSSNIPTAQLTPIFAVMPNEAVAKQMDIDYFRLLVYTGR